MRRWTWVVVLALVGLLAVVPWATAALARGSGDMGPGPSGASQGDWDEMYQSCHGAGGMMEGWDGVDGMMGGSGVGLGHPATLERAATALGLTSEALQARLAQGETIAQVAQAQNVATQRVVDAILAPLAASLDVQVQYGYVTSEQAQASLSQARARVEQAIAVPQAGTSAPSPRQYGPRGGGRGMMGGGMMGGGMMGGGMMGGGMAGWR